MTEGHTTHDKPMCIRVWLEVGHACEPRPRSGLSRSLALDWRIWVRGPKGSDISAFVHKVVFNLHPPTAFVYPKRVVQEPPYEIQESGSSSIDIPIHIYLKNSIKPKVIKLRYSLRIEHVEKSSTESRCIFYDFENPSEQLQRLLMKGGGEVVARTGHHDSDNKLLVVVDEAKPQKLIKYSKKRHKTECRHLLKKVTRPDEVCTKCCSVDFKILKAVKMTKTEIDIVSQLYLSYSSYEKSADALSLPPISDPIYRVPELPDSLKSSLTSVEAKYAMQ